MVTVESDYQDLMSLFLENYPELSNIPYINGRLEFYSIIESLDNYKNTKDEERLEEVREKIQRLKEQEIKMKK